MHQNPNLPSIALVSPETASTIYRHLSRTIGASEQATFRDVSRPVGSRNAHLQRHQCLLLAELTQKSVDIK